MSRSWPPVHYDYVTAGIRDFGSLDVPDKETDDKKAAKPPLPKAKISSLEDLPSLPTKVEQDKRGCQDESKDQKGKADDEKPRLTRRISR